MIDLVIVGGGPAGQAAAEIAVRAGLSVAVIDEQARPGGQILRQPPAGFRVGRWLPGRAYRQVKAQLARFEALADVAWLGRRSVVALTRQDGGWAIRTSSMAGGEDIVARRLLIAAGCYDMPRPIAGWTLPGTMSAGGVQAFIKSQQFVPGERFVVAGSHPLQLLVAAQIVAGGGTVAAVLFEQPVRHFVATALGRPWTALRHAGPLLDGFAAWRALRRAGVPVRFAAPLVRITGHGQVTEAQWLGPRPGALACDRVALCYGFLPQADLPRAAGATMHRVAGTGGWAAGHDPWMRSSVAGLYVAGETTGVAGADVSLVEGRLAGLAIAVDAGVMNVRQAERRARPMRRARATRLRFAAMLDAMASAPTPHDRQPDLDMIICRCEDVTLAKIDDALGASPPPATLNGLKLRTRAGMGLCQGRGCEHVVQQLWQRRNPEPLEYGAGFTARFPVRPTPISDLID